ncbi:MAG: sensor histidine kinase, partial [Pseudomonadota bacterium]
MAQHSQTLPGSTWRPMRDPFSRWPRASDTILAIVVFMWSMFISDEPNQDLAIRAVSDLPLTAILVHVVASGALYWRRSQPLIVLGVDLAALALLMGLGPYSLWAMPFALYSVGRYAISDQWNYYGVTAALALATIGMFDDGETIGNIGFGLVFVFLVWYIGRRNRIRGDYLILLQERAAQLEREQTA